jgi:hypothetical protein
MLRQRCDAGLFKPLLIEIIARRRVAPAFEPKKFGVDGWLELLTKIEQKGSRDWTPRSRVQNSV